ncbi:hypothetical protein [Teredinibacter waterburyi]|jgi:hypothetical protein|uniref:hypothetical protein n=1 Tax=Teredinibacter waterburyi TaxID=1500538 RepID=UPI00165EDCF7|nr:hypothetical protein [Teredinibacter waterburyi]
MKRFLLFLCSITLLAVSAVAFSADIVVATKNTTHSQCNWNIIYQYPVYANGYMGSVSYSTLSCNGISETLAYKSIQDIGGNYSCYMGLTNNSTATKSGTNCNNISILHEDVWASPPPTTCQLSGKAGYFYGSAAPSNVSSVAASASAYCSPECGINVLPYNGGEGHLVYCASQ